MSGSGEIVIVGAAGRTGRPLLERLVGRGAKVRALVRSQQRAEELDGVAPAVIADLGDPTSLANAFAGADVVHLIPPLFNEAEIAYATNAIRAATEANIGRFVYHSVLHSDTPQMPHHCRKAAVERMLRDSDLAWTIVQPAMYASTPLLYFDKATTALRPPFNPERLFSPIDNDDLSDAVANVLTQSGHEFAIYELAGPALLSVVDMAAILSAVLGKPVQAMAGTAEAALRNRRFSPESEREARAMYSHYDAHGLPGNGRVLEMVLGRPPRTFRQSAESRLSQLQP
jgi:NAD(P)H dehydrogenase (quinone)